MKNKLIYLSAAMAFVAFASCKNEAQSSSSSSESGSGSDKKEYVSKGKTFLKNKKF